MHNVYAPFVYNLFIATAMMGGDKIEKLTITLVSMLEMPVSLKKHHVNL
ncbi:TPA: hypothetical protein I1Q50_001503 [Staphylococcus aureus]|nr:hypothetical protein [Staphylococcus aureus]